LAKRYFDLGELQFGFGFCKEIPLSLHGTFELPALVPYLTELLPAG
jgi:hypothetical protein